MAKRLILGAVLSLCLLYGVWFFYMRPSRSLIHLDFPEGYQIVVGSKLQRSTIMLTLAEGMHTLFFKYDGEDYAAVIYVSGGGEIYHGLTEEDIHPVTRVKYSGG